MQSQTSQPLDSSLSPIISRLTVVYYSIIDANAEDHRAGRIRVLDFLKYVADPQHNFFETGQHRASHEESIKILMDGLILPCLQADSKDLDSVRKIWDTANAKKVLQSFSIHLYGNRKPIIVSDIFSAIGFLVTVLVNTNTLRGIIDKIVIYMALCQITSIVLGFGKSGRRTPATIQVTWVRPSVPSVLPSYAEVVTKGSRAFKPPVLAEFKLVLGCSIAVRPGVGPGLIQTRSKSDIARSRKEQLKDTWPNCQLLRRPSIIAQETAGDNTQDWGHCAETLPMIVLSSELNEKRHMRAVAIHRLHKNKFKRLWSLCADRTLTFDQIKVSLEESESLRAICANCTALRDELNELLVDCVVEKSVMEDNIIIRRRRLALNADDNL